ncbi:hypothetical protein [Sphingobacterium gobiense]|uniref:Uncharacterized protein n=1 Tax=Sphingobacterium gobiense TaxID=1382456 RepID=A0A2S9JRJ8_9SPHI|nr:hypothetical protein [Sphingobacterium gobiense]PRD55874.1 hypothetical protein C5749_00870 [Sphingobacterium gobiense]
MSVSNNNNNQGDSLLGDLEKTIIINNLMDSPFPERDEQWRDHFLSHIGGANLKLGEPEVAISKDGFPYIQLQTVAAGESFQAFVIKNELDTILEQGFGVAINADLQQPDWIFSYGDLVNLKLNGSFYTDKTVFTNPEEYLGIDKDEEILVGQPAEEIFPNFLRRQIREFLQYSGIKNPKIMLIARNYTDEERASQDLVFNIIPTQFPSEKDFNTIMNTIQWFLPKQYSFFGADELAIENGFQSL